MVPIIYLIGLAAVTLFSSDMFDDRETSHARELLSTSPGNPNPSESGLALKKLVNGNIDAQSKWQRNFRNYFPHYFTQYLPLSPAQRSNPENLYNSLMVYNDFCIPHFGFSLNCNERIQEILPLPFVSNSPLLPHPIPKAEEIRRQSNVQEAVEFPLDDFLPYRWASMARNIHFDNSDETVWDFLRQNVRSVIFRPEITLIGKHHEIAGTINPLTRTCIIETPNDDFESDYQTFFTLVHEAFHLYSYAHIHTQNANYHENPLLEERNTLLFTAKTQLAYIEQHHNELSPHELQMHISLYLRTYHVALSSNCALGLPEDDDEIHFDLDHPISLEMRNSYPTDHLEGYIRMRNYDNVEDFINEMTERMMREYSARSYFSPNT